MAKTRIRYAPTLDTLLTKRVLAFLTERKGMWLDGWQIRMNMGYSSVNAVLRLLVAEGLIERNHEKVKGAKWRVMDKD